MSTDHLLVNDCSSTVDKPLQIGLRQLIPSEIKLQCRRSPRLLSALMVATAIAAILNAAGRIEASDAIGVQVVFLGAVVLGLLPMSGVVSEDLESGFVRYLMQKSGSLRRYYVTVALARLVGIGVASTVVGVTLSLPSLLLHGGSFADVRYTVFLPSAALLTAAIVFAMSAFGLAKDLVAALVYLLISSIIAYKLASASGLPAELLRFVCFPLDALLELSGGGAHRPGTLPAMVVIVLHVISWVALGALTVKASARRNS